MVRKKHQFEYNLHRRSFFLMVFSMLFFVISVAIDSFLFSDKTLLTSLIGCIVLMNAIMIFKPTNDFLSGLSKLDYLYIVSDF